MTRIGGDSVNLAANPAGVDVAFYYTTGHLGVTTQADAQARHPGKVVLGIDVTGADPSAAVRDWETGDKGGNLEQWVKDHNEASGRKDACVYCNRSTIGEVRRLTGSQVLGRDYWLWVTTLDGTLVHPGPDHLGSEPFTYPGVVACQVATLGGYDLSVIWDDSWHPSQGDTAHLKANILQNAAALDRAFRALVENARRL